MNVLLAPDKFKGTLTAETVCHCIERGLRQVRPELSIRAFPLADGGEGTLDVFRWHTKATEIQCPVHDPLMRPIEASYLRSRDGGTAFIEMARASGLALLQPGERNPLLTTTYGTGELIGHALDHGVQKIILGIGGSATNDAGLGAVVALGGTIWGAGKKIEPMGGMLDRVDNVDVSTLHPGLQHAELVAICDVDNPFYGPHGAAYVYGPQKGANAADVQVLDQGLANVARIVHRVTGIDLQQVPGAGAGGGFGGGAHALLSARLQPGTEVIFQATGLQEAMAWADVVITGEGKLDAQTLHGKLIAGLGAVAHQQGKRMWAVCGHSELTEVEAAQLHIQQVFSMTAFAGKESALTDSAAVLEKLTASVLSEAIFL